MADYVFGIEEEYFLTDLRSRNVRQSMPSKLLQTCQAELGKHVTSELLQAQIEVSSSPCRDMNDARRELSRLRAGVAERAGAYGLGLVAAATHPLALWREQRQTQKARYAGVINDVQITGLRNMLCGMHVHVQVPDPSRRIELMYRTLPYLHLFLALSTSSPFWQGHHTGLAGYRLAAHEEMPRTGLPDLLKTGAEYDAYVDILTKSGIIADASFIWWCIRPSTWHPTLELRIADVCTWLDDALAIAALFRCLLRYLVLHAEINADLQSVDRAIAVENKWRAQRFGTRASFVRRGNSTTEPLSTAVSELIELLRADAEVLGCVAEIEHAGEIVVRGSSADHQLSVYEQGRRDGRTRAEALKSVVDWLLQTTITLPTGRT